MVFYQAMSYQLRDVTPEVLRCIAGLGCPAIYEIEERTPSELRCFGGLGCPAVYEVSRLTPKDLQCVIGTCPEVAYDAQKESYLIVGKVICKEEARAILLGEGKTLADKIGEGEALVCVPKGLLAEIGKSA